jgi:hypothetical protein
VGVGEEETPTHTHPHTLNAEKNFLILKNECIASEYLSFETGWM